MRLRAIRPKIKARNKAFSVRYWSPTRIFDASGRDAGEQGGEIAITADNIGIGNYTVIDASGHSAPQGATPSTDGTATMTAEKGVRNEQDFLAHANRAGGSFKIGGIKRYVFYTAAAKHVHFYETALFERCH